MGPVQIRSPTAGSNQVIAARIFVSAVVMKIPCQNHADASLASILDDLADEIAEIPVPG